MNRNYFGSISTEKKLVMVKYPVMGIWDYYPLRAINGIWSLYVRTKSDKSWDTIELVHESFNYQQPGNYSNGPITVLDKKVISFSDGHHLIDVPKNAASFTIDPHYLLLGIEDHYSRPMRMKLWLENNGCRGIKLQL
jgi:hypothetical protein